MAKSSLGSPGLSKRILIVVSSVLLILGLAEAGVFWRLNGSLPPARGALNLLDAQQPAAENEKRAAPYLEAARSGTGRFLAPREAASLREAADMFAAAPTTLAAIDKLDLAIFHFNKHASVGSTMGVVLSSILAIAGLLGLLHSRIRRAPAVGAALTSTAVVFGGAALVLAGKGPLMLVLLLGPLVLGAFGQIIAVNLLPGKAHPLVAGVEARLRRLPPAQRSTFIAVRIVGGAMLVGGGLAVSIVLALALKQIGAGVSVIFIGAIVWGLSMMTVPTIAVVRLWAARRERT